MDRNKLIRIENNSINYSNINDENGENRQIICEILQQMNHWCNYWIK